MSKQRGVPGGEPDATDAEDHLATVAGTPQRWAILETLASSTRDLGDVVSTLDAPRTTIRHNLSKLETAGLIVEARHQQYRITALGEAVRCGLTAYEEHVDVVQELRPFFDCVSPSAFGGDVRTLAGADVTVCERSRPYAPGQRLVERLAAADSVTGMMDSMPPLEDPELNTVLAYTDTRFLITPAVAHLLVREFQPAVENALEFDLFDVRVGDVDVPYGLVVVDDSVLLWAMDENDKPHALVETDDPDCRTWALETVEDRFGAATPLGEFLERD